MLTRVQIKNINAIDYCDIDFQKNKYKYLDNMIYRDKLVNPIAFYGSNGSGKSSFLKAITQVLHLMILEPKNFRPFMSHSLNLQKHLSQSTESPSKVNIEKTLDSFISFVRLFLEIRGKEYEYYLETSMSGYITKEYLLANDCLVFNRDTQTYFYREKSTDISKSLYPAIRKIVADNQGDESVFEVFSFLSNMGYIDASKHQYCFKEAVENNYLDLVVDRSAMVKNILSQYQEFPSYNFTSKLSDEGTKKYYIQLDIDDGYLSLPYQFMSTGMFNQSVLLTALLSLPTNGILFVDEIEDALHPLTILDFIKVAQEKNIQLVFSSHNTYLLQKLRPDQIIFANWKSGYSTYKKLSDIYPNIREINNIEKMYFSSMFDEEIKNG